MITVIPYTFTLILKILLYFTLVILSLVIILKLWLEPVAGICKCKVELIGKVALVTGGNSGIGLETARALAEKGARVIITGRNDKKAEDAVEDIKRTTGNTKVEYKHLDLSRFNSIRKFADEFNKDVDRLDILVNNASCLALQQQFTEDGMNMLMQVNYLGPFLLTTLLMEKLIESRPSRIVIVSSYAYYFAKYDVDVAGLKTECWLRRYANSKLCSILWAKALSNRLPRGVIANALHPGIVKRNCLNRLPLLCRKICDVIMKSPKEGAQTSIHLCVSAHLRAVSGKFFVNCKRQLCNAADDSKLVDKIWNESLQLIKNK